MEETAGHSVTGTSQALSARERATVGNSRARCPPLMSGGNIVPQPRLSMRKVKEVRRPHYELRLGQRQIRPLLLDLSEHRPRLLEAGRNAGLPWPLPPDCDEGPDRRPPVRRTCGSAARLSPDRTDYDSVPYQLKGRQSSKDSSKPSSHWNAKRVVNRSALRRFLLTVGCLGFRSRGA